MSQQMWFIKQITKIVEEAKKQHTSEHANIKNHQEYKAH
jgi:hypothetical protein